MVEGELMRISVPNRAAAIAAIIRQIEETTADPTALGGA